MNESNRLFTVRLWPAAETDDGHAPRRHDDASQWRGDRSRWHGKIQSLPDGEAYHFRDWLDLIQALETMLSSKAIDAEED